MYRLIENSTESALPALTQAAGHPQKWCQNCTRTENGSDYDRAEGRRRRRVFWRRTGYCWGGKYRHSKNANNGRDDCRQRRRAALNGESGNVRRGAESLMISDVSSVNERWGGRVLSPTDPASHHLRHAGVCSLWGALAHGRRRAQAHRAAICEGHV